MTSPSRQASTAGLQTVAGASAASFVPSKPTANASGKTLLAVYYLETAAAITMPSGFANALDVSMTGASPNSRMRVDWKIADGSEGTTLTWSWTGSVWRLGGLFCIDGAQTTGTPVELGNTNNNANVTSNTSPPNVALTGNASVDDFVILAGCNGNDNTQAWSAPATWTLEFNSVDDLGIASIAQAVGAAPATNHVVLSGTTASPGNVGSVVIAVKSPASAAAGFPIVSVTRFDPWRPGRYWASVR